MMWLATLAASCLPVAAFVWQDGVMNCNDGNRYISGTAQPSPFHRRWCGWPALPLKALSLASLLAMGVLMGTWQRALLFMALPGAWFIATHPTTVDGPAMLLAWVASLLMPTHPYVAVLLSCVAGFIHERGPVFAAVYAMNPLLLIGLVAVGWWRTPAKRDSDPLVGLGLWDVMRAHRPYQDLLDPMILRTVGILPLMALGYGCSLRAWMALALAFGSRVVGTDTGRFLFWAAPALIVDVGDFPLWVLGIHLAVFRRAI